jgi:ABC-2 type transport system ATP-binding protein
LLFGKINMIETDDLSKKFGDFWAVDGVNLSVKPGQVLALLGQNGAGKTTTVRLLTSVLLPTRGTAIICGHDVIKQPEKVRSVVGVLTEQHGLYLRMTGLDYLDFFGRVYRIDPATIATRSRRLMELFGLEQAATKKIGEYSKGMRQKLALARTLIHEPPVLLLDEPTSAMDPESARLVRDSLASLRSTNRTIIICTHNLMEAETLADCIAIVYRGHILMNGTVDELKLRLLGPVEYEAQIRGEWPIKPIKLPKGITMVHESDHSKRFQVENPKLVNPEFLRELIKRKVDVVSFSEVPRTLEQVYLKAMEQVHNG